MYTLFVTEQKSSSGVRRCIETFRFAETARLASRVKTETIPDETALEEKSLWLTDASDR